MRVFLLTRDSACQRYCANTLYRQGIVTDVIVEDGASSGERPLLSRIAAKGALLLHPAQLFWSGWNYFHQAQYYGRKVFFDREVFGSGYDSFDKGLNVVRTPDINADLARQCLQQGDPGLVFVFGTRIVKPWIFDVTRSPVINMHWGWSPDYRGEGIITALAFGGVPCLGVTVHALTAVPDGGDIICRESPDVDAQDNFYSIGLKLARSGTAIFADVFRGFVNSGEIKGVPQGLKAGQFYSVRFMRENPQLKSRAWKRLKAGTADKKG